MTGAGLWIAVVGPWLVAGLLAATAGRLRRRPASTRRIACGGAAASACALAILAAIAGGDTTELAWGSGLSLVLARDPTVAVIAVLVPAIALPVSAWAAAHEDLAGLERLLAGLIGFVGSMELLVLAGDLLTLAVGWELVSALSWLLIAHHRGIEDARAAGYAYVATRLGGLGLLLAAGASLATAGSFAFADLDRVAAGPAGSLFAAGILLAAATKSAQLPFSPWLFRAMRGPSSVSALLHSSTMVAAGAWLLVRLHQSLALVWWFDTAAIAIGLSTALAAGVVACLQPRLKRLLAASTSAQFGLVLVAVGSGFAGIGLLHIVAHAAVKSLLFLVAGTVLGVSATRSTRWRAVPWIAGAALVGAWGLSGLPPLGTSWTKEEIIGAAFETSPVVGTLAIAAAALTAAYAARFLLFATGGTHTVSAAERRVGAIDRAAPIALAIATVALVAAWIPAVHRNALAALHLPAPAGGIAEQVASILASAVAAAVVIAIALRRGAAALRPSGATTRTLADWLALPHAIEHVVVRPTLALARVLAELEQRLTAAVHRAANAVADRFARAWGRVFGRRYGEAVETLGPRTLRLAALGRAADDAWSAVAVNRASAATRRLAHVCAHAIDRGLHRALEIFVRAIDGVGHGARTTQTGAVPVYYAFVVGGLAAFVVLLALGSCAC